MKKKYISIFWLLSALFFNSSAFANIEEFNNYANKLAEKGAISQNNDFRIFDNITRAELAKLAVNSEWHSQNLCQGNVFNDVNSDLSDLCGYIEKSFSLGKISFRNGFFEPKKHITRGEAAKIFFHDKNITLASHLYNDESEIDASFIGAIKKGITLGCLSSLEKFRPNDSITRGEAFKMTSCIISAQDWQNMDTPALKILNEKTNAPMIIAKCQQAGMNLSLKINGREEKSIQCETKWMVNIFLKSPLPNQKNVIFYENTLNGNTIKSPEIIVDTTQYYYGGGSAGSSYSQSNTVPNTNTNNNSWNHSNSNISTPPQTPPTQNNPPQCVNANHSPNNGNTSLQHQVNASITISENLKKALKTGDASVVSKQEIIESLKKLAKKRIHDSNDLYKTVFELNDDLTENANSIKNIKWNPDRNIGEFNIFSKNGEFKPLFVSTKQKYNLGIAGQVSNNARVLMFGNNPFWDSAANDNMHKAVKNAIKWTMAENQNGQTCSLEEPKNTEIVIANFVNWQGNEVNRWLTKNFPNAKIHKNETCSGEKLTNCVNENTKLIVLGADANCSNHLSIHKNILQKAKNEWIGIMYISAHHGDNNACTNETMKFYDLGYNWYGPYFNDRSIENAWAEITSPQEAKLLEIVEKMESDTFDNSWIESCTNKWNGRGCDHSVFVNQYGKEVNNLRTILRNLDSQKLQLFQNENPDIVRLMILLGDKYREEIEYPVTMKDVWAKWYKAYFANSTVYNTRKFTTVEKNLGNFVTKKVGAIVPQNITLTAKTVNKEYAPGVYLWPWQKVTITRTDASDANVSLFVNMLRDTTKVFTTKWYARPAFIKSPAFNISAGETLEISNPYGGPLYFSIPKVANETPVTFEIQWAGKHPVITDPGNEEEVRQFINDTKNTEAEWVVVATEFLMIHSRLDHWNRGIDNNRYNGDMKAFFDDLWKYLIYNTYSIAGYNNGGSLMPTDKVLAYCNDFGIDCLAKKHQLPERIQHVVSDKYSACGDLCSWNPYDTTGPVGTVSWGDGHEIGHNLQHDLLKIYGKKSIENSNNVYPYAIYQKFNETAPARMEIRHLNRVKWTNIPQSFQWIKEWLAKENPEAQKAYIKEAIWTVSKPDEDPYAKNSERYSFFVNLAHFMKYYNPDKVDTGWEAFSMMNIMRREFSSANGQNWDNIKATIWFNEYSFEEKWKVNGNDFMLITSSKIIGKDMRGVFDLWGVDYSKKASDQVASMNLDSAEKLFFPMYDYPRYYQGETPILMTKDAEYTFGKNYQK